MARLLGGGLLQRIWGFLLSSTVIALVYNFWISPYLFNGFTVTTGAQLIQGLISFQIPVIVLAGIILAWWTGYLALSFTRRGK